LKFCTQENKIKMILHELVFGNISVKILARTVPYMLFSLMNAVQLT